jgi:hypothetical protein
MNQAGSEKWWRAMVAVGVIGGALFGGTLLGVAAPLARADDAAVRWQGPIRAVDAALARRQYSAALKTWQDAYAFAMADPGWDGLVAAADAYRRIGEATGFRKSADGKARELYLNALGRARRQGSVTGVLRVGEAFVALGDPAMATQCARFAQLVARDPEAQADVRAFVSRTAEAAAVATGAKR